MCRLLVFGLCVAVLALMCAGALATTNPIANPSFDHGTQVTDQVVTLAGNAVGLGHNGVIASTVVVKSQDGSTTYVHNTDFKMSTGNVLNRVTSGAIPSGATLKVSYQYADWQGWTTYGYTVDNATPPEGGVSSIPNIGGTGGEGTFDVLLPDQGLPYHPDGTRSLAACGHQSWGGGALDGGCYQTFTAPGSGFILISARAYSIDWIDASHGHYGAPLDILNRVRAGLVNGTSTSRTDVTTWVESAWSKEFLDITVPVPMAGVYTLFIEDHVPWASGIYNDLWDNVRWYDGVVSIISGPEVDNVTETSADVVWDTDVASSSKVSWDNDGPPYWNTVTQDDGTSGHPMVTHHVVHLTGLLSGSYYYYAIESDPAVTTPPKAPALGGGNFMTQTGLQSSLLNGNFEAVDASLNPTIAPWSAFGKFDGLFANNLMGAVYHSPTHCAGIVASQDGTKSQSGILQRVAVTPGTYAARVWIFTDAEKGNPANPTPDDPSHSQCRIGIDPNGGVDDTSTDIVWSDWDSSQLTYKQIGVMVQIPAGGTAATIFLQVHYPFAVAWVKAVFDDVTFGPATPAATLGSLRSSPTGWLLDESNLLVTKVENFTESSGDAKYFWVQENDRSVAAKVRTDLDSPVSRGDRVRIVGRSSKHSITEFDWAEAEVNAQAVTVASSNNSDPKPLAMTNRSVCGGTTGSQRGATGATGANNTALLVRTAGVVTEVNSSATPPSFLIDDGSNITVPGTANYGIRVFLCDPFNPFAVPPAVGQYVAVTGVSYLDVYDPTLDGTGKPNGNGDEVLVRSIRTRDSNDVRVIR